MDAQADLGLHYPHKPQWHNFTWHSSKRCAKTELNTYKISDIHTTFKISDKFQNNIKNILTDKYKYEDTQYIIDQAVFWR